MNPEPPLAMQDDLLIRARAAVAAARKFAADLLDEAAAEFGDASREALDAAQRKVHVHRR